MQERCKPQTTTSQYSGGKCSPQLLITCLKEINVRFTFTTKEHFKIDLNLIENSATETWTQKFIINDIECKYFHLKGTDF